MAQAAEAGVPLLGGVTAPVANKLRIPVGDREVRAAAVRVQGLTRR